MGNSLKRTQYDCSAGEVSPNSQGRIDIAPNYKGLKKLSNFIPLVQGGITRRPPTKYAGNNAHQSKVNRNISFVFSTEDSYVLVFSESVVNVYKNRVFQTSFSTTYLEEDMPNISYTQSNDEVYIACKNHPPRKITRMSDTSWTIEDIEFTDGPYFDENESDILLTISSYEDSADIYCNKPVFEEWVLSNYIEYKYEENFYIALVTGYVDAQNLEVSPIENILTDIDPEATISTSASSGPGDYDYVTITSSIAVFSTEVVNKYIRVSAGEWYYITEFTSTTEVEARTLYVPSDGWTTQSSAADTNWWDVAYGNNLFVAVSTTGTGNRVMTSPDGTTWTLRTAAASNVWRSVTYGNNLFVAVSSSGTGNRVMTSPDGITWTSRTSAADNDWLSVTYGNGLFVAVAYSGTGNRVMTSPDGTTWTIQTSSVDNDWQSVTYGNNLFVAVSNTGTGDRVMTSIDGATWTSRTSAADNDWRSITYGNGLFVAVSASGTGNRVMTSPDGITWTSRTSAADNDWTGVAYGDGLFAAVSVTGTGNRVMTSPDGTTWTIQTSAADNNWQGVAYGDGLFVAVSYSGTGNRVMTWEPSVNIFPFSDNICVLNNRVVTTEVEASESLFESTDVGRHIRMRLGDSQIWGKIAVVTSQTQVTVEFYTGLPYSSDPESELESNGQTKYWRLGAWNSEYGYPECVAFHDGRLCFANNTYYPNRIWASESAKYFSFAPTDSDSNVLDTNAIYIDLNSSESNGIKWLVSNKTLLVGTRGNIWQISPSYFQNSITPSDIGTSREDPNGAEKIQPIIVDGAVIYVQEHGRAVREMFYDFQNQSFQGSDLNSLADHLFKDNELGSIKEVARQTTPYGLLWIVTETGKLCSLTYSRQYKKFAFARHTLGGTDTFVESVCVVPDSEKKQDDVYFTVRRTINGSTVKYVEVLGEEFFPTSSTSYAPYYFQDCAYFYTGPETNIIGGLIHLEGEEVAVTVGGGYIGNKTVTGGKITLDDDRTNVGVGLFSEGEIAFLPFEAMLSELTSTHGVRKKVSELYVKFLNSLGCVVYDGDDRDLGEFIMLDYGQTYDIPPQLFSGTKYKSYLTSFEFEPELRIVHESPTPLTILIVTVKLDTE